MPAADQPRWRCRACCHDVSLTSGTLFAWHELPLRTDLLAVAVFCNEVRGESTLALARDLDVQHKTAFVLAHKLRKAIAKRSHGAMPAQPTGAAGMQGLRLGGKRRAAEIDGACSGGHVRPGSRAAERIDRRLAGTKSGKRRAVVVMRERDGRTLPQVFTAEDAAVASVGQRIAAATVVHADEGPACNPLQARAMRCVNRQHGYSIDGAGTNGAASCFSRLRRAGLGRHHHIAGPDLIRCAHEAAWREDLRRASTGEQACGVVGLAMRCPPSADACGCWRRAQAA